MPANDAETLNRPVAADRRKGLIFRVTETDAARRNREAWQARQPRVSSNEGPGGSLDIKERR